MDKMQHTLSTGDMFPDLGIHHNLPHQHPRMEVQKQLQKGLLQSHISAQKELEEERAKSLKAQREIENRRKDADENEVLNRVFNEIEKTYKHSDSQEEPTQKKKNGSGKGEKGNKYLTQSLSKYGKKEQKLIAKIYNIIKMILPKDYSEMVIKKIQEELSK